MSDKETPKHFREAFRKLLVAQRETAGLSPGELAAAAGTSPAQVSRWESGLYVPKLYWVARLARALGIEVSTLVPALRKSRRRTMRNEKFDRGPLDADA